MPTSDGATEETDEAVVIRQAVAADLSDLLSLYEQLAEHRGSALPAGEIEAATLLEAIVAQPGRQLLVAEVGGEIVGTADLLMIPNLTHSGAPWASVENVVVDQDVRGRGIGRALIDEVVRRCASAGCYKVQLLSKKSRADAHEFYRSVGFEAAAEGFRRYLR